MFAGGVEDGGEGDGGEHSVLSGSTLLLLLHKFGFLGVSVSQMASYAGVLLAAVPCFQPLRSLLPEQTQARNVKFSSGLGLRRVRPLLLKPALHQSRLRSSPNR